MKTKATIAIIAISSLTLSAQAQESDEAGEPWFDATSAEEDPPEPDTEPPAPPKKPTAKIQRTRPTAKPKAAELEASSAPAPSKGRVSEDHPTRHQHGCGWHGHCGRWHSLGGGSRALALTLGRGNLEMPELAERMEAAGYPRLSKRIWLLGLEGTRTLSGGLVLGMGGRLYRTETSVRRDGGADAELRGGSLHVKLGRSLVNTRRWLVYPAVQLGGYYHRLVLDPSDGASFDEVLGDPARESELSQGGAFVGAVLAIDKRFAKPWRGGNGFWSIGLRVGVTKSIWSSGWRLGDDTVRSGPKDRPRMAYVALALGGGRWYSPKR